LYQPPSIKLESNVRKKSYVIFVVSTASLGWGRHQ
jgi:hypothetical protein